MLTKLKDQPSVGKLIAQYDQLPRRDQQALTVLAIAVFLGLLYFLIWRPITGFHDQAASSRENAEELLAWMRANQSDIERLAASEGAGSPAPNAPQDGRALMALVTRSAGESGLSLQRFEPSGNSAIRVWLEDVPFADVAAWLESLSTDHGVVIDQAAMDRKDAPGIVSVRLTLTI
ncbi:type II secretion system protein M [Marinobacter sp. NP-4(2019)]|uniref:type II secretion system protein GspM n=1 Tax=Marinobacter sp. NP-4(2019) TaxID=2488665 RepID=UPI000FC3CD08|nr:type II secretion system protein M [Marinobacter sp. NP-4(2019)]AZT83791.1 type II secretion system protein M [Marinobacter sp. NP-4(2019)]